MSLQKIKVPNIFSVAKGEKSSAYFDPVDILNLGANSKYNLRVYNEATNDFSFFPKRDTIKSDLFIPPFSLSLILQWLPTFKFSPGIFLNLWEATFFTDREVCQKFQPSYDIFRGSDAKVFLDHRFRAPSA